MEESGHSMKTSLLSAAETLRLARVTLSHLSSSYQRCLLPSTSWATRSFGPHSMRVWSSINQTESMSQASWSHSTGYLQPTVLNSRLWRQPVTGTAHSYLNTLLQVYISFHTLYMVSKQGSLGGSIKAKKKRDLHCLCCSVVDQTSHLRLICWHRHNLQENFP